MNDLAVTRRLCLVLEDNWIIAVGLSDQLKQNGFEEVECHTSCSDALTYLGEIAPQLPDLALLDVTLGSDETCLPVAQELVRLRVPIIIASGYGLAHELKDLIPDIPALQKPILDEQLCEMVDQVLGR